MIISINDMLIYIGVGSSSCPGSRRGICSINFRLIYVELGGASCPGSRVDYFP